MAGPATTDQLIAAQVRDAILSIRDNPIRKYLPRRYWDRSFDFFSYGVEYDTLAASAAASPQSFNVQNDADFLVLAISHIEATATAGTTVQEYVPVLVRIFDTASGAAWMNQRLHLMNISGSVAQSATSSGAGPRKLVSPRLVGAGSQVTVEATNLEANARRLWITFHGVKIFFSKDS
jgi:hypothetical protein